MAKYSLLGIRAMTVGVVALAVADLSAAPGHSTTAPSRPDAALVMMVLDDIKHIPQQLVPFSLSRAVPRDVRVRIVATSELPNDFSSLMQEIKTRLPRELTVMGPTAYTDASEAAIADNLASAIAGSVRQSGLCGGGDLNCLAIYPPNYSQTTRFAIVRVYFSEILHPSLGVYVLKRQGNGWVIHEKRFLTFI